MGVKEWWRIRLMTWPPPPSHYYPPSRKGLCWLNHLRLTPSCSLNLLLLAREESSLHLTAVPPYAEAFFSGPWILMCKIETMLVLMQRQDRGNPVAHGTRLSSGKELPPSSSSSAGGRHGLPKGTVPWFAAGLKKNL